MSKPDSPEALARWDAYWKHGFLTSCTDAFKGNYAGSIATYWRAVFDALAPGSRIVDVCTGNGAVAALAAQCAVDRGIHFDIHGVDLAAIHPDQALAKEPRLLEQIAFYPRTSAADMPFDDASMDLVCGQYALEYTPLATTVQELARVIRPGGHAQFILHHSESVVLRTTREELSHRDVIFGHDDLFGAVEALCRKVATAQTPEARQALSHDPQAEALRHRLNASAAAMTSATQRSPHPELLLTTLGHARAAYVVLTERGLDAALARLEEGKSEVRANLARLDDLAQAALDRNERQNLIALLLANGFESPAKGLCHHDDSLIGWTLSVTRKRPLP